MKYVKALSHVHSNWSYDGHLRLDELKEKFQRYGVKVLYMTEHDRTFDQEKWDSYKEACKKASSENFLFVPGIEYSCKNNRLHVLVWGDLPFFGSECLDEQLFRKLSNYSLLVHRGRKASYGKILFFSDQNYRETLQVFYLFSLDSNIHLN